MLAPALAPGFVKFQSRIRLRFSAPVFPEPVIFFKISKIRINRIKKFFFLKSARHYPEWYRYVFSLLNLGINRFF